MSHKAALLAAIGEVIAECKRVTGEDELIDREVGPGLADIIARAERSVMGLADVEVRRNSDGSIDELIATGVALLHIEQMDAGHWWVGVDLTNGALWHINLYTGRNAPIEIVAEQTERAK